MTSTDAWLCPTASMAWRGEKLGRDSRIGQPMCCGLEQEPSFLRTVTLLNSVDNCVKGYRVRLIMSTYILCVSGFFYRMYIDSNHRDSRI
jgi:hypothetical protein